MKTKTKPAGQYPPMTNIHLADPPFVPHAIKTLLYDALEIMRALEAKLTLAIDEWDESAYLDREYRPDMFELERFRAAIRIHIGILQELIGGTMPTVSSSVLQRIVALDNLDRPNCNNPRHSEGVLIASGYAKKKLSLAINRICEDDDASETLWGLAASSQMVVEDIFCSYESTISTCYVDEILELILAGKPVLTWKEFWRAEVHASYPSKFFDKAKTRPIWDYERDEPRWNTPTGERPNLPFDGD